MGGLARDKLFQLAKGFRGRAKNCIKIAKIRVERALRHAYVGRKLKKRVWRSTWITRINAGAGEHGVSALCVSCTAGGVAAGWGWSGGGQPAGRGACSEVQHTWAEKQRPSRSCGQEGAPAHVGAEWAVSWCRSLPAALSLCARGWRRPAVPSVPGVLRCRGAVGGIQPLCASGARHVVCTRSRDLTACLEQPLRGRNIRAAWHESTLACARSSFAPLTWTVLLAC